jgi:hypothetical protein
MNTNLQAWHNHFALGKALDIDAGDGETNFWLAEHGFAVDALKPEPQRAFALRDRVPPFSIQIHQVDMLKFDIPIKHYDLIIATAVSHFIDAE